MYTLWQNDISNWLDNVSSPVAMRALLLNN